MSTASDYRMVAKTALMKRLYQTQLMYWNRRLSQLSLRNAVSLGRKDPEKYSIYFNNRRWCPSTLSDLGREGHTAYCIELNPEMPDYHQEMTLISEELLTLINERYEADRFLSGLLLFHAPPSKIERILGATLYAVCSKEILAHTKETPEDPEPLVGLSLQDYIEANKSILRAMNQRLLINLIDQDAQTM